MEVSEYLYTHTCKLEKKSGEGKFCALRSRQKINTDALYTTVYSGQTYLYRKATTLPLRRFWLRWDMYIQRLIKLIMHR